MPEPRLLTHDEAAAYCRLTTSGFDAWVARGIVPGPLPGTKRWDRKAIDRALDTLSGIPHDRGPSELDRWLEGQEPVRHASAS